MQQDFEELSLNLKNRFPSTSSFFSGFLLFLVDAFALLFCIALGFFLVNLFAIHNINFKSFINYSFCIPFMLFIFACEGLYPGIMIPPTEEIRKFSFGTFLGFLITVGTLLILNFHDNNLARKIVLNSTDLSIAIAFIISFILLTIFLPGFREIAKHLFRRLKRWGVPAVVYCDDNSFPIVNRLINNPYLGYHPAIIISTTNKNKDYRGIPIYEPSTELSNLIKKLNIKVAIISNYSDNLEQIMTSYRYTITVSKNQTNFTYTQQLKDIAGILAFSSIHNLTFKYNLLLKRLMDIAIIIVALPLILPVFIILMFLTKITSKGPIFYGHERVGKNGKPFKCLKFRSMNINSQEMLEKILATDPVRRAQWEKDRKFEDDPRVTKFGKFLRKTSLDELPQLINILIGQMSFIGPRPVTEPELEKYGKYKNYVLSVSPGLSGMWQISGRSDTGYEERIQFDTYYIQNWSIWLDIWILIKTFWVVLEGKGAY